MKFLSIILMLCVLLLASPVNLSPQDTTRLPGNKINGLSWLLGKWQMKDKNAVTYEFWEKQNDSTYKGVSFTLAGSDTVFYESILLQESGSDLFYIPLAKGQNDEKPVVFTFVGFRDSNFVFENPAHDFPQKIVYRQTGNGTLLAYIEGAIKGKTKRKDFPMQRILTK